MDDPRLTPARADLAAKYLEGKVEGRALCRPARNSRSSMRIAPLRDAPSSDAIAADAGAEGRARHDL